MTTESPTSEARGPHLDDEALSAALDGEASAAGAGHLDRCPDCRARVDHLRSVQALVATAPPVDPARRERALAAAVAAMEPLAPRRTGGATTTAPRRTGRRRRWTVDLAPWVGVAALVLLVALAVPLLAGGGGDDDAGEAETTAGDVAAGSGEQSAAAATPAPAVDVGDLGVLAAGADLRPVVDRALGQVEELDGTGPSADAAGGGQEAGEQEGGEAAGDDAARATTTSPAQASGGAADTTAPTPGTDGAAVCEAAVRAQLPDAGALLLTGTATVDEAPAVVHGFAAPRERPTVLVALVAVDGCRIVTFQSYGRG